MPRKCARLLKYIALLTLVFVVLRVIVFRNVRFYCIYNSVFRMTKTTQDDLDYFARNVDVKFNLLENTEFNFKGRTRKCYNAEIILHNTGTKDISFSPWSVYFYQHGDILPRNGDLQLETIAGDLYCLTTPECFTPLPAGEQFTFSYTSKGYLVAQTDVPPNWYIAAEGLEPRIIKSTEGESLDFISPFDGPEKWKRGSNDLYNPYTPSERYKKNLVKDLNSAPSVILPTPLYAVVERSKPIDFNPALWVIVCESHVLDQEAKYLSEYFKGSLRITNHQPLQHFIKIEIGDLPDTVQLKDVESKEGYTLSMNFDDLIINIKAPTSTGVFYGIQSMLSVLSIQKKPSRLNVIDAPRYGYRGFMLDVCRNFFPKEDIFILLDVMSSYKLNKLHLHLSEDEGWRLEIPDLPELTELGSCRGHTYDEHDCLYSTLGSGPHRSGLGNGYYTIKDYQEILHHAKTRHIQVIPEIDMPGHSRAAIISMNARYRRYEKLNDMDKANEFLLTDPRAAKNESKNGCHSVQRFDDNSLIPCIESTYRFVEVILDTLIDIHKNIQPLKSFHFGGDEVPMGVWEMSPTCRDYLKEHHPDLRETDEILRHAALKRVFFRRIAQIAKKKGLTLHGWEDAFYEDELTTGSKVAQERQPIDLTNFVKNDDEDIFVNTWMSTWERGYAHRPLQLANQGFKVILSSATHLYFDHPHEPDPYDRGLYWATRAISLQKVFNFMPDRYLDNIDSTSIGRPLTKEQACKEKMLKCIELEKAKNIKGIQGQLWSETVRSQEHLHMMIYPRILCLAERAWNHAEWEKETNKDKSHRGREDAWQDFINSLGHKELKRLEEKGIRYWLPPPGAKVVDGRLQVNSMYPGGLVMYSQDEGKSWKDLEEADKTKLKGNVWLANRYLLSNERGRHVTVTI